MIPWYDEIEELEDERKEWQRRLDEMTQDRDKWKESVLKTPMGYAISGQSYEKATVDALIKERDDALAKVKEVERHAADDAQDFQQEIAKLKCKVAVSERRQREVGNSIRSLADGYEKAEIKAPPWMTLRALLPPETALDVLSDLENYCVGSDRPVTEGLAKLRNFLEKNETKSDH